MAFQSIVPITNNRLNVVSKNKFLQRNVSMKLQCWCLPRQILNIGNRSLSVMWHISLRFWRLPRLLPEYFLSECNGILGLQKHTEDQCPRDLRHSAQNLSMQCTSVEERYGDVHMNNLSLLSKLQTFYLHENMHTKRTIVKTWT